jgi:hypothetical protein
MNQLKAKATNSSTTKDKTGALKYTYNGKM